MVINYTATYSSGFRIRKNNWGYERSIVYVCTLVWLLHRQLFTDGDSTVRHYGYSYGNPSLPNIPLILLEFMLSSLPCILFLGQWLSTPQPQCLLTEEVFLLPRLLNDDGDLQLKHRLKIWQPHTSMSWYSSQRALQASTQAALPVTLVCISSLEHRVPAGKLLPHTHLPSCSAFCIVQNQPRPNWALCPGSRMLFLKDLSCHPQFCTPPTPLNLDAQTRNLPRQTVLEVSKTCWIAPHATAHPDCVWLCQTLSL